MADLSSTKFKILKIFKIHYNIDYPDISYSKMTLGP